MNDRQLLALGLGSALLALVSTPILDLAELLYFAQGAVLAVVVPLFFGAIAVGAGLHLYRRQSPRRGVGVTAVSVVAVLVGVGYGLSAVL